MFIHYTTSFPLSHTVCMHTTVLPCNFTSTLDGGGECELLCPVFSSTLLLEQHSKDDHTFLLGRTANACMVAVSPEWKVAMVF